MPSVPQQRIALEFAKPLEGTTPARQVSVSAGLCAIPETSVAQGPICRGCQQQWWWQSSQICEPKTHLREGEIYRDSDNNIIRLHSIRKAYCVLAYVALRNPGSEMHGSMNGVPRGKCIRSCFHIRRRGCGQLERESTQESRRRRVQTFVF
jgi:hypothetical protein